MKPQPRLIALNRSVNKPPQIITVRLAETIVGREKGCKIRIPSTSISRRHCRIAILKGLLTVEDLESSNGTFVNEVRITELSYLKPGDVLRVGPFRFLVHYHLSEEAVSHLISYLTATSDDQSIDVELLDPDAADPTDPTGAGPAAK